MASPPTSFKCVITMVASLVAVSSGAQEVVDRSTYILATGRRWSLPV